MKNLMAVLALSASLLAGCEYTDNGDGDGGSPTAPPAPVTVTAAGSCSGLQTGIQCGDASRCTQGVDPLVCSSVIWTVSSATTGIVISSRAASAGEVVQFLGLSPDVYAVKQTVAAGGVTHSVVYNVTVPGLFS